MEPRMANAEKEKETTILMVEDDVMLCDLIGSFLRKKGYIFHHHNSYEGAIDQVRQTMPDLVIMDLHFPDGNGLHLCKLLKADKDLAGIPILVLTTRDYPVEKEIALSTGVTDFFHKPMDYGQFADKIDEVLGKSIELYFWGVRGSIPCPGSHYTHYGGNTTCLQIRLPGQEKVLVFDAGTGIRRLGNELQKKNAEIAGRVFFSHAHWDHIHGFPFFKPFYQSGNRFDLHMPPQMGGSTKDVLLGQMSYTYFPVTSQMLQARLEYHIQPQAVQHYDGFSIQYMTANHPVETAIYKVIIGKKIIVFAPDNELEASFVNENKQNPFLDQFDEFISGADVLIHDAQYDRDSYPDKKNWGHSAWEDVVERAIDCEVKHLILTHFDPESTDEHLHQVFAKLTDMVDETDLSAGMAREDEVFRLVASRV